MSLCPGQFVTLCLCPVLRHVVASCPRAFSCYSTPSSQVVRCTWVLELHACSPLPEGWDLFPDVFVAGADASSGRSGAVRLVFIRLRFHAVSSLWACGTVTILRRWSTRAQLLYLTQTGGHRVFSTRKGDLVLQLPNKNDQKHLFFATISPTPPRHCLGLQRDRKIRNQGLASFQEHILTNAQDATTWLGCDVAVTCDDVRCFLWTVLELNWCCAICISRGLIWQMICYLTLSSLMFLTNIVVVITELLNSNHFQYQWIGKLKEGTERNGLWTRYL